MTDNPDTASATTKRKVVRAVTSVAGLLVAAPLVFNIGWPILRAAEARDACTYTVPDGVPYTLEWHWFRGWECAWESEDGSIHGVLHVPWYV